MSSFGRLLVSLGVLSMLGFVVQCLWTHTFNFTLFITLLLIISLGFNLIMADDTPRVG